MFILKLNIFRKEVRQRMLSNIGTPELIVLGFVLLLFFGGKKLPELARGVGDSVSEFRKAAA